MIQKLRLFLRELKFCYQKLTRGFSDAELWDLHHFMAEWILPRLIAFRDLDRMGFPGNLYEGGFGPDNPDEEYEEADKKWAEILGKMIWSFKYVLWDDSYDDKLGRELGIGTFSEYIVKTQEEKMIYDKEYQEGMELFSKYFMDLWD